MKSYIVMCMRQICRYCGDKRLLADKADKRLLADKADKRQYQRVLYIHFKLLYNNHTSLSHFTNQV